VEEEGAKEERDQRGGRNDYRAAAKGGKKQKGIMRDSRGPKEGGGTCYRKKILSPRRKKRGEEKTRGKKCTTSFAREGMTEAEVDEINLLVPAWGRNKRKTKRRETIEAYIYHNPRKEGSERSRRGQGDKLPEGLAARKHTKSQYGQKEDGKEKGGVNGRCTTMVYFTLEVQKEGKNEGEQDSKFAKKTGERDFILETRLRSRYKGQEGNRERKKGTEQVETKGNMEQRHDTSRLPAQFIKVKD